jgi:DNA-binding NarL/FixJ family response regulator
MLRILIVDDHIMFREGLAALLKAQKDMQVVGEAGTVQEAISLATKLQPDIVLMDFGLPDGTGIDATRAILAKNPGIKVVFLTVQDSIDRVFSAIRIGASGYLMKNLSSANMIVSLRGLANGEAPISRKMTLEILREFSHQGFATKSNYSGPSELTMREVEILQELTKGFSNQEIAAHLSVSEITIKNHVHHILKKLGLNNRREAARYAKENGLTSLS